MSESTASIKAAEARVVASRYPAEQPHMEQVARLSAMLFDAFFELHGMTETERDLLISAALLHDVGISESYSGHHKKSRKLIMKADLPSFAANEREVVANVARYHRKADPSKRHRPYRELCAGDRQRVKALAALLRLADGLDRAHEDAVSDLHVQQHAPALWVVTTFGRGDLHYAAWAARRKSSLFEEVFRTRVLFESGGIGVTEETEPGCA
jgi:exopolyphosphatase/guanosine-5'-triphosphate,3'-diphosphate pyrophosphatase